MNDAVYADEHISSKNLLSIPWFALILRSIYMVDNTIRPAKWQLYSR